MTSKSRSKYLKKLFVVATLVLSASILLYFLFTGDGIASLGRIMLTLRHRWLILALFSVVACWLLEGFVLNTICRHLHKGWRYGRSFFVGMVGFLYNAVTPFSTGGQPMQIYTLRNLGMDTGMAGSIVAVKTLTYQIVMVAYSLIMVVWKLHYFQMNVSNFSFLTIIGLISNTLFISAVFLFMISEKTTDRILRYFIRLFHRLKLCRHPEQRYEKIHGHLQVFHDASKIMGNSSNVYLFAMAVTAVQITLNSMIPYFIYRSFNLEGVPVTTMLAAQVFVAMVSAFIPLPGASGGAEGSFFLFFRPYFKSGAIIPAILLWRILTYYFNIIFGGLFAYIGSRTLKGAKETPEQKE